MSKSARLRVQLCGRFAFVAADQANEPELPGRRGRLLLAYLAAHRDRPVPRGQLQDALWGESAATSGAATLNVLLSKARAVIAPATIDGRGMLHLSLPAESIIDLEVATAALHQAQSANALGNWRRAWPAALTAMTITRRGFLTEYDDPWTAPFRARVDLLYEQALACYAESCLNLGGTEVPGAERAARRLIELSPISETGYQLLMQTLATRGDTAAALAVYEDLRRSLRAELGVDPGPAARRLHQRLLDAPTER